MLDAPYLSGSSARRGWSLWKPLALIGFNLVLLAVLIFLFPALLAYLIAAFLLFNGVLLLAAAYHLRSWEKRVAEPRFEPRHIHY